MQSVVLNIGWNPDLKTDSDEWIKYGDYFNDVSYTFRIDKMSSNTDIQKDVAIRAYKKCKNELSLCLFDFAERLLRVFGYHHPLCSFEQQTIKKLSASLFKFSFIYLAKSYCSCCSLYFRVNAFT